MEKISFFSVLAYGLKQLAMNERLNENERGSAHNKVKILSFCVFRADFFALHCRCPEGHVSNLTACNELRALETRRQCA